ncbi:hypothetical protein EDC96DRAFT_291170 [Choanephora cucurbitarum]|nr:hypothetical protein EDC96DRAFT_291170 [Choanephora cucurbitarum]
MMVLFLLMGSGKSYSLGTIPHAELEPAEEGILPRFARLLFRSLQQSKEDMSEVYASFVMVDREIRDLLVHSGMVLQDRQDARQKRVYSTHDLLRLLNKHTMHDVDVVFTITLRHQKTVSKFHFIDISQKYLDLSRLDPFVQHCQHKLWFTCISCARQDLSLIQETLQSAHHLPLSPEASQSLRSQITQLQLQIAHLQGNQLMEEEIKMIREEMEQIKSYSIQVSQELVETQSARDTLLLQLTQERPTEAHPLIQQYAQQIQDLKLEVAETRGKLNEPKKTQISPAYHYRIPSSLSSSRKKRPIIQRMRTSSSSLLKKTHQTFSILLLFGHSQQMKLYHMH